jgi:hypothetical protein
MSFCKINSRYILISFLAIILSLKIYPQEQPLPVELPSHLEINFVNENEFKIRAYLVEKYNPGDCFGMSQMKNPSEPEIKVNDELIAKIKKEYNIQEDSKAKQFAIKMSKIGIMKESKNKYSYEVRDARCPVIRTYKGKILLKNKKIIETIIEKTEEMIPD